MDVRLVLFAAGLVASSLASAQIHTATGPAPAPKPAVRKPQRFDAGTEPLQCEQYKLTIPHWYIYCRGVEVELVQGTAKREGRPVPSKRIVDLPASGTPDAKGLGLACIGGSAMRRLQNGWEQVRDGSGNWLRCRVK